MADRKEQMMFKRKKTVIFTEKAFSKTIALIEHFDIEIGWHGTVTKKRKDKFLITDIIVYPQTVDSTSILADQFSYDKWLMNLGDDEFESLRMHGHSHVNFGVSPSLTDKTVREGIVKTMRDDQFYIFIIMNKKYDLHIQLFDLATKRIYTNDVKTYVILNGKCKVLSSEVVKNVKRQLETMELIEFIQGANNLAIPK